MSDLPTPQSAEQTALACYLRTVVAIGNCMAEVCPSVGTMYRDRLLKLPRRLGFEATPQALEQSRDAVETDLLEYARTASTWINTGSTHASRLLDHLKATEDTLVESADLQLAFLEDLAEHIGTSAEVDEEAQLRVSFKRYAAGLRAYSRRAKTEKLATIADLRKRREDIEAWLKEATISNFTDADTGFLNRAAAERRLQTEIDKKQTFCVIVVGWTDYGSIPDGRKGSGSRQIMKEVGDRLASTIRPYDMIFRWSQDKLVTIFEASEAEITARVQHIAGWLGDATYRVEVNGEMVAVKAHTNISVVEHLADEPVATVVARIESVTQLEVAVR
jgi:GGDEF domain-containing protein